MEDYEKNTVEVSRGPGDAAASPRSEGDIKRDLSSRHINMIALAGMIVRNKKETIACMHT